MFTPTELRLELGHTEYETVVSLLLARNDVNPNKPTNDGKTPLWWASCNGHEGVVRLLLARGDVNPRQPDNRGQTLGIASPRGWRAVAALLKPQTTPLSEMD